MDYHNIMVYNQDKSKGIRHTSHKSGEDGYITTESSDMGFQEGGSMNTYKVELEGYLFIVDLTEEEKEALIKEGAKISHDEA